MSEQPPQASEGAPEWMVSYADMITIMMAFFVVLYASTSSSSGGGNSTQKDEKKTERQASSSKSAANERIKQVLESVYYRFGPEWTIANCWVGGPAELRGRSAGKTQVKIDATGAGRLPGEEAGNNGFRIRTVRPGETIRAGARVYFDDDSTTLSEAQTNGLRALAEVLAGKTQRMEVRGHTSRRPLPPNSPYRDHLDLAYARCRAVREYLASLGIDPRRIRLAVAGENEPPPPDGDAVQSSRVEIHLLNEFVTEPAGPEAPATAPLPS